MRVNTATSTTRSSPDICDQDVVHRYQALDGAQDLLVLQIQNQKQALAELVFVLASRCSPLGHIFQVYRQEV